MKHISSNKLEIVYRGEELQIEYFLRTGQKKTVLYLHGLGCSRNDFVGSIDRLRVHNLAAFDFPGSGNSPYPGCMTLGMDDLVEITNIVVSELDLEDPVIIGHSMGGLVALLYIRKYGDRVKGFINVEGNLTPEDCFFSREVVCYSFTDFRHRIFRDIRRNLALTGNTGFKKYAQTLESASEKACYDYSVSLVEHSDGMDLMQQFCELAIPKLFVYGSENRSLSYIPELRGCGCEVAEIPDSNHFPCYDNPQTYYQVISDFLDSDLYSKVLKHSF